MTDLISIVIPVYNVSKYLKKCLDSVVSQTYKNLEILLVDDGSSDESGIICDTYSRKDNRVIVFHNENGGVSRARNFGLNKATGRYITFIDSDDYVSCDYVECLYNGLKDNYVDMSVIAPINFSSEGVYTKIKIKNQICTCNQFLKIILEEKKLNGVCWGKLYKLDICRKIKFDENMKIAEDMKFLIDYLSISNGVQILNEYKYYYYLRKGSAVHSGFNNSYFDEINYCRYLMNANKNSKMYIYTVIRYMRIIMDVIIMNDFENYSKKFWKEILNKYKYVFFFSIKVPMKKKIKLIYCYLKLL